jgi:hypothetical protein
VSATSLGALGFSSVPALAEVHTFELALVHPLSASSRS